MDGDNNNEAAAVTVTGILPTSTENKDFGATVDIHSSCGGPTAARIKEEDSLICNHLPSVVSLASGTLSNHTMPLGNIVSVATPSTQLTGALQDQLLVTVQSLSNGTVDSTDELKLDSTNADSSPMTVTAMGKLNGAPQLTNTGLTTMMNIQGLAGIPQMAAIGMPGLTSIGALGVNHIAAAGGLNTSLIPNSTTSTVVPTANVTSQAPTSVQHQATQPSVAPVAMPQFILAGGQLVQGIQGAQLLIPTSSGVATQQILTIPVNQINTGQLVQLVTSNGQVLTTTLNNLQGLTQSLSVGNVSSPPAASAIPAQQLVTNGLQNVSLASQMAAIPQIITNGSGQVVAITPQLIAQPIVPTNQGTNLIQISNQAGHIPSENKNAVTQIVSSAAKSQVQVNPTQSVAPTLVQQAQAAQIQIAAVGPSTQVTAPSIQRTQATTGSQVLQVSQVSQNQVQTQQAVSTSPSGELQNTISQSDANTVDGINLEEIKEFAKAFKIRRLSLGLTQTQVGQALSITEGPAYSQSAICRFEKLDITPKSAQKIKPVLERWMKEAEERYKNGAQNLTEFIGTEPSKKRKRRTSFTPQALEILNQHFERNTHPSGAEMTELAEKLNYDREVVRVWFCNKRQALKNTIKKLKVTN